MRIIKNVLFCYTLRAMKYILLSDIYETKEVDDGRYMVKCRIAGDTKPEEATIEVFTEGDLYTLRRGAPNEANAIALADDWLYYNTESGMLFDYVFK